MGKHLLCGSWCESLFSFPICSRSCIQDSPLDGQGWLLSFHSGATSPNRNRYTLAEGFCTASLTVMEVRLRCVCFSWVQDPHEVSLEKLLAGLKNWVFQVLLLSRSVVSDSVQAHRRQPTRLCHPWDSPGKNTGVGCHFCLQCRKVKSESEVTQSCPTLRDPMDCSLPGSSVLGIFQARVLEWVPSPSPVFQVGLTLILVYPLSLAVKLWKNYLNPWSFGFIIS